MRKLLQPIPIQEIERRKPSVSLAPLLEEGSMAKVKKAPKAAVKAEVKRESKEPKKKGLSAQQYAAILSFVLMVTAILSQATAIIGCTSSTLKEHQDAAPVVTTVNSMDKGDSQSNATAPMIAPKPPQPESVKPVPNPNGRLNQTSP
ncbi:hypothetical protein L0Y65_02570 [Candidatus Micrarchaeota archaeon]|nr:hypothetical protein [Candidatus Micrarchaeota archaeon]